MNEWIKEQTQPTRQNITMSEWAEEWFNTYTRNLAVATRRNKKSQLDIFCRFHRYGDRPLASFRPIDLQRFLNSLEGKTHTTMTVIKATVKSVFTSAFSNRIIEPFDLSGLTIPKGEDGTHRAITEDERSILISTWQGHPMGKYAMGYLFTGARRNELLAIQWEDIDMVHDTISINKAYNQYTGGFASTKTKSGNRTIPLLKPLKNILNTLPKDAPPFPAFKFFDNEWKKYLNYLKRHGITEKISPHDLRDSFATFLYDCNVDIKMTQKLLGHKDVSTTMQFYIRLSEGREERELQKIKEYFDTHFDTQT